MGIWWGGPGTVVGAMADLSEPDVDDATGAAAPSEAPAPRRSGLRSLDRRTVAICVVLGIIAAIITVLVGSALSSDDDTTPSLELEEAGPISSERFLTQPIATVDGDETNLASFQEDQPMLVNLWASNCLPCVEEMPLLNAAQTANSDITFVGVATQDDLAKAKALAKRTGITYPWALDPTGELYYESKGIGMPTTVLLAADGSVVDAKTGWFDSATELQAFIDQAG